MNPDTGILDRVDSVTSNLLAGITVTHANHPHRNFLCRPLPPLGMDKVLDSTITFNCSANRVHRGISVNDGTME